MAAKPGPLRPHEERLNYSRREPEQPAVGQPGLGDSFLIVTEGEVTERMYFESVRHLLQVNPVTVVMHPPCTDAEGLIQAAIKERDSKADRTNACKAGNADVLCYDHVWVLFDTDVPTRQKKFEEALRSACDNGIHVGHSTPCVELWLLLHFRDRPGPLIEKKEAERALSDAWGHQYDKSEATFQKLWHALKPGMRDAVRRSAQTREYHKKGRASYPANPSTELDLLIRALNASVPSQMRIL